MDWATQPHPFRRYGGAEIEALALEPSGPDPTWDALFTDLPAARPADRSGIGEVLLHALALSAWKEATGPDGRTTSRWALRVNPSSGNLHPTEAYLVDRTGVHHYAPDEHALERRGAWGAGDRDAVQAALPPGGFLVALTGIHWRESWKYGERAYRYCQHDAGHALAALAVAAARVGWRVRRLWGFDAGRVARLLGIEGQTGPEREHLELVAAVGPEPTADPAGLPVAETTPGVPNRLSTAHRHWPALDEVASALAAESETPDPGPPGAAASEAPDRELSSSALVRGRRSAVAMDGRTIMPREAFFRLLARLLPSATNPVLAALAAPPEVSPVLFVHRVEGLAPGLYALPRTPDHETDLRRDLQRDWSWERDEDWPAGLPLFRLAPGDLRAGAAQVSCGQAIAGDGAFSLGLLARFAPTLERDGPAAYPRLFHETGALGQLLYLEAEAAGLRGTGIGCYFDDEVHRVLGLEDRSWQSLYHFTVGGAVDDARLRTAPPYGAD